jgi:hypothetical protein
MYHNVFVHYGQSLHPDGGVSEDIRAVAKTNPPPQKAGSTLTLNRRGGTRRSPKAWNPLWFCYCFITSRQWPSWFCCLVLTVVLYFVLCHRAQIDSGAHQASFPVGMRISFCWVYRPACEVDHSSPSSPQDKNTRSFASSSLLNALWRES